MIHAYHVMMPCYGFWLPNDPRGSWSDFVAAWELAKFGKTTRHLPQRTFLKGAAARSLLKEGVHPFGDMKARKNAKLPGIWARYQWKAYLDSEEAIENAIAYLMDNPVKEGKRPQHWSWVRPFSGLPKCWNSYGE